MIKKIKKYFSNNDENYGDFDDYESTDDEIKNNNEDELIGGEKKRKKYKENLYYSNDNNDENKEVNILLVSPETFNDTLKIADNLKKNKIVILNLDDIDFEEGRKIVDFLSGTVYALGGSVNKISGKIILFAPIYTSVRNEILLRKKIKGMEIPDFNQN